MRQGSLFIILFIILTVCLLFNTVYGQAISSISTNDLLLEVEKLKTRLDSIEKQINEIDSNQDLFDEKVNKLNVDKLGIDNSISKLENEIENNHQLLIERYDTKFQVLGFQQNALNAIMVLGGLIIAFWGISSVSDYRKRIIKEKLEESLKDEIMLGALEKVKGDIKERLFESYSNDLNSLSSRVKALEEFEPIIKVLKGMK